MRLYLPAIVLICWAVSWSAGVTGDELLGAWLAILAVATADHIHQSVRRRRDPGRT